MPSQSRKHRGYATQRMVAEYWRENGFPYCTDTGAGRQGADVLNTKGVSVEVKARTGFEPLGWMRQAATAATEEEIPCVVMRPNGAGQTTITDWPVILRHEDFVNLLRDAGYGEPRPLDAKVTWFSE